MSKEWLFEVLWCYESDDIVAAIGFEGTTLNSSALASETRGTVNRTLGGGSRRRHEALWGDYLIRLVSDDSPIDSRLTNGSP